MIIIISFGESHILEVIRVRIGRLQAYKANTGESHMLEVIRVRIGRLQAYKANTGIRLTIHGFARPYTDPTNVPIDSLCLQRQSSGNQWQRGLDLLPHLEI